MRVRVENALLHKLGFAQPPTFILHDYWLCRLIYTAVHRFARSIWCLVCTVLCVLCTVRICRVAQNMSGRNHH